MEAHILRTLSDCGEPHIAEPREVPDVEPWQQFMVQHGAGQLEASSPESEVSSKDESAGGSEMLGDEDEGFDEEFCDSDEPPLRPVPDLPPLNLQDLNNTDLQSLLGDNSLAADSTIPPFPTSSLLDDIDPGVYMLEAEQSTNSLLDVDPRKSPVHSPFPVSTHSPSPSPVCATMNSMSLADGGGMVEQWNSYPHTFDGMENHYYTNSGSVGGSEYGSSMGGCTPTQYLLPPPSPSLSCSPPPPSADRHYDLDMLAASVQSSDHHTIPASPSHIQPHTPPYQQQPACSLTLPMNFGSSSSSSSLPPATPPSSEAFQHPLISSPSYYTNYEYNPLLSGQTKQAKGCTGGTGPGSSPHGTVTDTTSGYTSCSTQTPLVSSPSPAPTSPSPPSAASLTNTTDDSDIPKQKPSSNGDVVHMPFYKFKKILDSPSIPEEKKNNIKNIRRRGKNKIAAKTCRQRKMDLVLGLQQEIEHLRGLKSQIAGRTNGLQREIELWKARCSALSRHRKQGNC